MIQGELREKVNYDGQLLNILDEGLYHQELSTNSNTSSPSNLAYVMYTSGSTGRPKGVMVEQRGVVRLVKNINYIDFEPGDKIFQTGTLAFDASTFEIWGALLNGLELHLGDKEILLRTKEMENYLQENQITILWLTAPLFNILADERPMMFKGLRYLLVGGDIVSPQHINKVRRCSKDLTIINGYGPTENTTFSTCFQIDKEYKLSIPIGGPINNSTAYVVDRYDNLAPIGVYGELCVGGHGLARGYLNKPQLTKEKFVLNPFVPGQRMYRTGDLVRWQRDGNLQFLGRVDNQVKIRGFRIEPGEIESALLNHQEIKEAVVIDRENDKGNKYLAAYLVSDNEIPLGSLKEYLSDNLPDYMIPSYFIFIEKMPLNRNGKIKRKALPEPTINITDGVEYQPPANRTEARLASIWRELLSMEKIGRDHHFFDLGGHSLKATILVSKIHKEFDVEVSLQQIFKRPTLRELAQYIQNCSKTSFHAIERVEEQEHYLTSSAQNRMYMLQQLEPTSTSYNIPAILEVKGQLNLKKVQKVLNLIISRHETLRTSFETIDDQVVQIISDEVEIGIEYEEETEQIDQEVTQFVKEFIRPFELDQAPLFRVRVVRMAVERYLIVFDMHHIISDGTSMAVLLNDFMTLYQDKELEDLKIQYKDYAEWQRRRLNSDIMKEEKDYWLERLQGQLPVLDLPTDYPRPVVQNPAGDRINFIINRELTNRLLEVAKESNGTLYMILLAGVNILLARYSGQEDIIIGSPIAGRPHTDLEQLIGMFINTLPMRNQPTGDKTVDQFIEEVRANALAAFQNQDYQFEKLVEALDLERDMGRNPIFDVAFTLQNMDFKGLASGEDGLQMTPLELETTTAKFDLTFSGYEKEEEIHFTLEYKTSLFKAETIKRMINHYLNILNQITINQKEKIAAVDMISLDEKEELISTFNNTDTNYPKGKSIVQLFEEVVATNSEKTALVYHGKSMTYGELNQKANRLARTLREKGVGPDQSVGILINRSFEMLVGILAILKAGGAYLPIDPGYPEERIKYMLSDSKTELLLTRSGMTDIYQSGVEKFYLDDEQVYHLDPSNLKGNTGPDNLAYIMYTSGTTGQPKGILTRHYNIVRVVKKTNYIEIGSDDKLLQLSNYAFDGSTFDIFGSLLNGATLVLMDQETVINLEELSTLIEEEKVTITFITTALFNAVIDLDPGIFANLRKILFGGERVSVPHVRRALEYLGQDRIIHVYGPTESTVFATYYHINHVEPGRDNIPIGSPIANTKIYILGANDQLQPIGVTGELCIAGDGLAAGYLNKGDLTEEVFVENPIIPGERIYRTGDLARWLDNGNIEFMGRKDFQVKIRGFRIELGEIKTQILTHPLVNETIILAQREENGSKYLVGYLVAEKELEIADLKVYLEDKLPKYMIPSHFIKLDQLPLTSNGKVNRKALPRPELDQQFTAEYIPPGNELERKMAKIWSEVLNVEQVGINDDLFQLGGHSLKATVLVGRIHKELDLKVPLTELFKRPTIRGISEYLASQNKTLYRAIEKVEERDYYQVSSAQKRIYLLQQFDTGNTAYNMPGMVMIEGELNIPQLEGTFKKLIKRHETLRTSFVRVDEEVVQRIEDDFDFKVEYFDDQDISIDQIRKEFIRPFNLEEAPLLRVGVIRQKKDKHLLFFDLHHIISDGTSMGILIDEFARLYQGEDLEELQLQYKDYAEWQNQLQNSETMKEEEKYWLGLFAGEIPVLNLPTDYPRPKTQSFIGDTYSFELEANLASKLREIGQYTNTTIYMLLLSALNILLAKYSKQDDIIIGSPIAGRDHADLENIIGMFVNTLAMRNNPVSDKTYRQFLAEVRENALLAYENQDYQFEELVEKLDINRDKSRNPLFDVMFSMQNMELGQLEIENLKLEPYDYQNNTAKFDLNLSAREESQKLVLDLEYSTDLFKEETIVRMARHLEQILKVIVDNLDIRLEDIQLMPPEERDKIIHHFNNTANDYQRNKTLNQIFEEQVEQKGDSIALVYQDEISYRELNQRANSLARTLRDKGVREDTLVGIFVERSIDMLVGIIAILKAGGAYLPISPEYPEQRIGYILEDSQTELVLTQNQLIGKFNFDIEIIDLNNNRNYSANKDNLEPINTATNLAYVIYTSGSTGQPKGVLIEHRSVVNILTNLEDVYPASEGDAYLLKTAFTFDVAVTELFGWFIGGGKLGILPPGGEMEPHTIAEMIDHYQITHLNFVPSMLNVFIDGLSGDDLAKVACLKYIFVAGETFTTELAKKCTEKFKNVSVENIYGPTEATIYATRYSVNDNIEDRRIPIGKPFNNIRTYILDDSGHPTPIGVAGELSLAGDCLARGYLGREELTAKSFVNNPELSEERIYRTGDLARFLSDGNIEFLGRIDQQVKIRGYRIEPGEIENKLSGYQSIKEVAVIDRVDKNGTKYLIAYFVADNEVTVNELRDYLGQRLPEYMIPSHFVQLESMPLNSSGKIDRKKLPESKGQLSLGTKYQPPGNQTEKILVNIWEEVLEIDRVGINDNYFELGGHSLNAALLVSRIHQELNVEVALGQIFETPTVRGLSQYIRSADTNLYQIIEPVEEKEYYQASSAQKRMYMLQQYDLESTSYNMPAVLQIEGDLKVDRVEEAIQQLLKRHETLRTSFEVIDGVVVQRVNELGQLKVDYLEKPKDEVKEVITEFIRPFNLAQAPLIRTLVIRLEEDRYLLIFDIHHIIFDGFSMGILIREFAQLYQGNELEELKFQYKDYAEWQNQLLETEIIKEQEKYWIDRFSGELPILNLPTDYPRPVKQSLEGGLITQKLDRELTQRLNKLATDKASTMYMILLSAVNILLSKYSRQEDIIVGSPIAGRPRVDFNNIIGMFVNTLAMRNNPSGDQTFSSFLKEVKENSLEAFENQTYQFEDLVENLDIVRDMSRNPLFDVAFSMQNTNIDPLEIDGLQISPYNYQNQISKFDLTISAVEEDDNLILSFEYSVRLFKEETVRRMILHLINILEKITDNRDITLAQIELVSQREKEEILQQFNNTRTEYPLDSTIQDLFESQVKDNPDRVALVFMDKELTYRQLNDKANSLAHLLRSKGVENGEFVGIIAQRSLEMVIGIVAILKAGGAYLPIDPGYPRERIEYMITDCSINIILTQGSFNQDIDFDGRLINLLDSEYYLVERDNPDNINSHSSLAYLIYTSGSTGNPKGVMVEHQNVVRLVRNTNYIQFRDSDKILQTGTLAFDASTFEIWGSLLNGIQLHLAPKDLIIRPEELGKYLVENQITILFLTTALFNLMAERDPDIFEPLRLLYTGGEAMSTKHVNMVREASQKLQLFNIYGPTENTTFSTYYPIEELQEGNVPIGKSISNTTAYVLDPYDKLCPIGVYGELVLGGDGLARGYLNNRELTTKKFITNPYRQQERIYKTGDLVRWLPDGNLEFLGRVDNQVKIRGFRIEPGEIEHHLSNHPLIKETIVIDREDEKDNKYLVAYLVADKVISVKEMRQYLSEDLPDYMIPSYFIQLDSMPLNKNGKIDRKVLPEPEGEIVTQSEYHQAETPVEKKLVSIWSQVLGIDRIGINDNFFNLGGHSLKGVEIVSAIAEEFEVNVSLRDFFTNPTVSDLSRLLLDQKESAFYHIEPVDEQEYYQLSYGQRRLWVLYQLNPTSVAYNMPARMVINEVVEPELIQRVFKKLVARHESLRTRFMLIDGYPVQVIDEKGEFLFRVEDITDSIEKKKRREEIFEEITSQPFDLTTGPLLKVILVKIEEDMYELIMTMHHIITDGWSINLLQQEFSQIYQGLKDNGDWKLPELNIQYKDFATWQNRILDDPEKLEEIIEFWANQLEEPVSELQLPKNELANIDDRSSSAYRFVIPEEISSQLKDIAKEHQASLFITLLSAFNLFLVKITEQRDLIVGIPAASRDHQDLKNIVGFFVNTVIVRTKIDPQENFSKYLDRMRDNTLQVLEYQSFPLELILEKIGMDYPEISVFFNMTNLFDSEGEELENTEAYHLENVQDVKFDIACYLNEFKNGIEVQCHYVKNLFDPETIEYMMAEYLKILTKIGQNSDNKVASYYRKRRRRRVIPGIKP